MSMCFSDFYILFVDVQVGFGNDATAPKVEVVALAADGRGDAKSGGAAVNGAAVNGAAVNGAAVNGAAPAVEEEDDIDIDDI